MKTTSLGTFRDSQNPCLCSTYTIKSAVSYLSSRHHYQRINPSWNAFDNSMDAKAYEKICAEFNVDKNTDWRQKLDDNGGLGIIFNYITCTGYQPLKGFSYDAHQMSFTEYNKEKLHIDYISQQHRNAWSTFILDKSNGFTRPGVERINDSIRTYCWAILGSQSQIKSDILGVGSAVDAQKQFLANTEDAIQSPVVLPSQITRYQNALKYARTKVDYVFGFGLYMAPSNMELRIGTIQGYNNKIILSTHDQKLWWNATVNLSAMHIAVFHTDGLKSLYF